MQKILILGCGFAGLSAAAYLRAGGFKFNVTMLDRKVFFDFLPLLPDIIGRGINPDFLRFPLETAAVRFGFNFVNAEVKSVDLSRKQVSSSAGNFDYDYLIIAVGSETNFYGNGEARKYAFKLDDAEDARRVLAVLDRDKIKTCVISGGGYTGVEIATNLRRYSYKKNRPIEIIIVEKAPSILGPLPVWMKEYVSNNLKALDVKVLANSVIEKIEEGRVTVGAKIYENSILIWAAGVKVADFTLGTVLEKNPQGRYKVDAYLRLQDHCFAAGDAAYFIDGNGSLRMAVQFAVTQGFCVARNVISASRGRALEKYRPRDFGYIIPMANNFSCGRVFGLSFKGRLPTLLHYLMCAYRSWGLRNKFGIIADLMRGGAK